MDRDPRANELANLKEALANFEHQLDLFEARVGDRSKTCPAQCPASADPQTAFAKEVVNAMRTAATGQSRL
jgi:hypothetical protein